MINTCFLKCTSPSIKFFLIFIYKVKGTARYAGFLLDPMEGFGLALTKAFFALRVNYLKLNYIKKRIK